MYLIRRVIISGRGVLAAILPSMRSTVGRGTLSPRESGGEQVESGRSGLTKGRRASTRMPVVGSRSTQRPAGHPSSVIGSRLGRASMAFVLAFSLVTFTASPGQAQGLTGLTIGQLLDQLESSISNIIRLAGSEAQLSVMEAGQAALNAIGAARAAYADSLDKTLAGLTKEQREAFEAVRSLVQDVSNSAGRTTDQLNAISANLNAAVINLPFARRTPYVTRVLPTYFVLQPGSMLKVRIAGQNLGAGTPYLRIKDRVFQAASTSDTELMFLLPQPDDASVAASSARLTEQVNSVAEELESLRLTLLAPFGLAARKPAQLQAAQAPPPSISQGSVEGELTVFERKGGFLGLFQKKVPTFYRIALFPVPRTMGHYELSAKRNVAQEKVELRSTPSFRCESPHGEGTAMTPVSIAVTPNWTLDTTTATFTPSYNNHGAWSFQTLGPAGFTAQLTCYGWGILRGLFGVVVDQGSQGVIQGTFSYKERTWDRTDVLQTVKSANLAWGESTVVATLPPDTKTVIVNLVTFSGRAFALEGSNQNKFLVVDFNPSANTVTLTARDVDAAMAQQ